jgi:hypothetical protein
MKIWKPFLLGQLGDHATFERALLYLNQVSLHDALKHNSTLKSLTVTRGYDDPFEDYVEGAMVLFLGSRRGRKRQEGALN